MSSRSTFLPALTHRLDREMLWLWLVAFVMMTLAFHNGITHMIGKWQTEEYSHAWIVPPLAALIALSRLQGFTPRERDWRWVGLPLLGIAFALLSLGEISGIYSIINYGYLAGIIGLAWASLGLHGVWRISGALFYLVFMLPLPNALYAALSAKMQLWSSELGVALIRACDVSVFLEGNIIDLGTYQLEVAEACNGLRYLFPLISFGVLAAILLKDAWWKRVVLVLSTLPITIAMNSARIGMIGVLVDSYGIGMAEGAQHMVEGFVVFGVCIAVLLAEVWVLLRLPPRGGRFTALSVIMPERQAVENLGRRPAGGMLRAAVIVVALGALLSIPLGARTQVTPDRLPLSYFPMQVDTWSGRSDRMAQAYLDVLQLDDYVMADYSRAGGDAAVNFYISYYDSQRYGNAAHSPQECIPGGGWTIDTFGTKSLADANLPPSAPDEVNRALISRQGITQVVYYWFEQRGRQITNEYMVKGAILADALTRGRTDGAMVRLVTPINPGETATDADQRLQDFLRSISPHVEDYVPA